MKAPFRVAGGGMSASARGLEMIDRVLLDLFKSHMEPQPTSYSRERLVDMATAQRNVIMLYLMLILASLFLSSALFALAGVFEMSLQFVGLVSALDLAVRLVFFVLVAIQGGRLARAVEGANAMAYQILFWIPCLSLVALLVLSSRSNRIMKENGIKVGFFGVNPANIP
jgi:hypothetical protein